MIRLTGACLLVAANARAQYSFTVLKEFDSPLSQISGGILRTADGTIYGSAIHGGRNNLGGIFRVQSDGTGFGVIHNFQSSDGYPPSAELIHGADGSLYGTAQSGGFGVGTIFKLQSDGSGFTVLHEFTVPSGSFPQGGLLQGPDGSLFGTTSQGGSQGKGTVFRIQPDGSGFTTLHTFGGSNGSRPSATLILVAGKIYGTTYEGGASDLGTLFSLHPDGSGFTILHSFSQAGGTNPSSPLILATDGALYGTAAQGGASGFGAVFKIQTDGTGFMVLRSLPAAIGNAAGGVIQGLDGALYGGGHFCCGGGTIYRLHTDGSNLTTLHTLAPLEGSGPATPLVEAADGTIFGFAHTGGTSDSGAVFRLAPDGSDFATIHSLGDESGEGATLWGSVALGDDGRLFGVTLTGGSAGAGTVFSLARDGSAFSVLHSLDPAQGKHSRGGPIVGLDGALYGTTTLGGPFGAGVVFRVQPDGSAYTVLRAFNGGDGNQPNAALTQGPDGTLYGTTLFRGVFKIQPDGSAYAPLHSAFFEDSEVALATQGILYGATSQGGSNGAGLVFRVTIDGFKPADLHSFSGSDGTGPNAVIVGADGRLYGTTRFGGNFNRGTIYRMSSNGSRFVTLRFLSGLDGANPDAALLQLPDGRLVGTTQAGGANGFGTVFAMNPDGSDFTVLHAFAGPDGETPRARLVADSGGTLYGTTYRGGPRGGGVVFKLTPLDSSPLRQPD